MDDESLPGEPHLDPDSTEMDNSGQLHETGYATMLTVQHWIRFADVAEESVELSEESEPSTESQDIEEEEVNSEVCESICLL